MNTVNTYSDFSGQPAISVKVLPKFDFSCAGSELSKVDLWFYGKENKDFVYYERFIMGQEDKLLLKGLREKLTNITVTNFCRSRTLRCRGSFGDLIAILTSMKNLLKGGVHIHAGCVARNGKAVLMPGMPNVGKTWTVLRLLEKGYNYLADDNLKVDRKGTAYCNPTASAIGEPRILKNVDNLSRLKQIELQTRYSLRRFAGASKVIKPFMGKAWELIANTNISKEAKVTHVCLLEEGPDEIRETDRATLLNKTLTINRYSLPQIRANPIMLAYNFFNPVLDLSKFDHLEIDILNEIFEKADCYILRARNGRWSELIEKIV